MNKPILVIDLEATCADDGSIASEEMEIIELGAVWATAQGEVIERLQRFVRPLNKPVLTPFCKNLTHVAQADMDNASGWAMVSQDLTAFASLYDCDFWCSWGNYDANQIARENARHGVADPLLGLEHHNLKAMFAKARNIKQVGMKTALEMVGLTLEGEHHRALSDASNIARLLPFVFIDIDLILKQSANSMKTR